MKFFISMFILSITIANSAEIFRHTFGSSYSGYVRGTESKRILYTIPAGYAAKLNYSTSIRNGNDEVKLNYFTTWLSFNEQAMRGMDMSRNTDIALNNSSTSLGGSCDRVTYVYMELRGRLYEVNNHFSFNFQNYPNPGCQTSEPAKPKPKDTLPKLHVNGSSISSSVTKREFKKYKLYGQRSGKVDIVIDNLSNDVDLYVRKDRMVRASAYGYNCRPFKGGTTSEICTVDYKKGSIVTIGVNGYNAGSYRLQAYYNELMDIPVSTDLSGDVHLKTWKHYIVKNHQAGQNLIAQIKNLSADVDLYVKKDSQPTSSSYDCRPYTGGTHDEMCKIKVNSSSEKIYISVHGYRAGSYKLSLKKAPLKTATILLHGLASSSDTWDKLNIEKYDRRCVAIPPSGSLGYELKIKGRDDYCYTLDFGKYDRNSGLKDLLNAPCLRKQGCRGDYSSFDTLGREVSDAVSKVRARLGEDVAITLVGHSRGGLAASAYLGGDYPYKSNVKALLTTGTPFSGSPLGKIHAYLKRNCISNNQMISVGTCRQDWLARTFLKDQPSKDKGLDVIVPSVGFLVEYSSAYYEIYTADRIQAMQQGRRFYHNLVYSGVKLGDLVKIGDIAFNPFPSIPSMIASTIGENFSVAAETSILGTWLAPNDSAMSHIGDGIVPVKNQDISRIRTFKPKVYGFGGGPGMEMSIRKYLGFNSKNRKLTKYKTNTVHTEEPKQVNDLSRALDWINQITTRGAIPNLHDITMYNNR